MGVDWWVAVLAPVVAIVSLGLGACWLFGFVYSWLSKVGA